MRVLRPVLLAAFLAGIVLTAVIGTQPASPGPHRSAAYGEAGPSGFGSDIYGQRILNINGSGGALSTLDWLGIGLGSAAFLAAAGTGAFLLRRRAGTAGAGG